MIDCFVPFENIEQAKFTLENLNKEPLIDRIFLLSQNCQNANYTTIQIDSLKSTRTMKQIAECATAPYTLLLTKYTTTEFVHYALQRMCDILRDSDSVMAYADHFNKKDGIVSNAPVIDYQFGSLRDDFDFGSVLLLRTDALKQAAAQMDKDYNAAGLYDLRLHLSRLGAFVHINEFIYYDVELDTRKSGEKLFDYVDPKNRSVQIEMEQACTDHLKHIGGFLEPKFKQIDFSNDGEFEYDASVVIPCKNRARTIKDAISSALSQQTKYKFNVIVVDDNSTDGTVEIIKSFANDPRLIYVAQDRTWHGIGGNWNAAFHHPKCGRFAIQLDSDDVYSGPDTIQKIVDAFYEQNVAMVIGTYQLTDFNSNPIPPGVIDHKEWTPENGRNNALRINGLGAPRAFYTPLLRQINFPTTKYGEDYAVALRISREYQIGRIYDVLYNCRRWEDNSDANCDIITMNANNLYKDRIRTWELMARVRCEK
ncbi:MAG: glycosyltransferase family 2 protein [Paludibacteraceae bacterium]|nr:glycosyltransferase family 2 protein [Paludibacteraceae bacterium]